MSMVRRSRHSAILASVLAALLIAPLAVTQQSAIHKTTLQDESFPSPNHSILVKAVIDQGGEVPLHLHPGIEIGYILEGHATMRIEGQPALALSAGDSFAVPPHTVHGLKNTGVGPLTVLSTYVVATDAPISTPAPDVKR